MNVIEQTIQPKDGAINLHIPLPEDWGNAGVRIVVVYEKTDSPTRKSGTGLGKHRGVLSDMSLDEKLAMEQELTELRNEWERPIL